MIRQKNIVVRPKKHKVLFWAEDSFVEEKLDIRVNLYHVLNVGIDSSKCYKSPETVFQSVRLGAGRKCGE